MQKWEYLFVGIQYEKGDYRVRFVSGQEMKGWQKGTSFLEFANKLGEEGWEMCAFSDYYLLISFKRPKA